MKVLVIGITGMLGNALFRRFSEAKGMEAFGTMRSVNAKSHFPAAMHERILSDVDAIDFDSIVRAAAWAKPDVIVNAVGLIKQLQTANDPLVALPINALFPHRLARLAEAVGARFVHISTDCVFSGKKGNYSEADFPDAYDLYGRSKLLGEVDYPNAVTLRTSIIGRELGSSNALVDWFLAQSGETRGFTRAIFSGLPTVELADVISDHVLPRPELRGLYHVAAQPISKFDLLALVAAAFGKDIRLVPDEKLVIDRSLDASRFREATGYVSAPWPELVEKMRSFD